MFCHDSADDQQTQIFCNWFKTLTHEILHPYIIKMLKKPNMKRKVLIQFENMFEDEDDKEENKLQRLKSKNSLKFIEKKRNIEI
jgi:hypothetical protein